MNHSNSAPATDRHSQAADIKAWEALADKHMASGSARVLGKPSMRPESGGTAESGSAFLYKGAPLHSKNVGYFLSDMFKDAFDGLRAAGKSHRDASLEARASCYAWSEKHRESIPDQAGGV